MLAVTAFAVKNPKLVALPIATFSVFRFEAAATLTFDVESVPRAEIDMRDDEPTPPL